MGQLVSLSRNQELLLDPGKCLESKLYNPNQTFPLKQLTCRIGALVAPILHAIGMISSTVLFAVSSVLIIPTCLNSLFYTFVGLEGIFLNSVWFISSLLEIPQKLLTGPYKPPNYSGDTFRYEWGLQAGAPSRRSSLL